MIGRRVSERARDRAAAVVITAGGGLVIALVAAIIIGIAAAALPLFTGASMGPPAIAALPEPALAVGWDPRGGRGWWLDRTGAVRLADGAAAGEVAGLEGPLVAAGQELGGLLTLLDSAAMLRVGAIRFAEPGRAGPHTAVARWRPLADPLPLDQAVPWSGVTANSSAENDVVALAWSSERAVAFRFSGGTWREIDLRAAPGLRAAAVGQELESAALVRLDGSVEVVRLTDGATEAVEAPTVPIARVRFLVTGRSLVAAGDRGGIFILQRQRRAEVHNRSPRTLRVAGARIPPDGRRVLADDNLGLQLAHRGDVDLLPMPPVWRVVRELRSLEAVPTAIAPAAGDRSFVVAGDDGSLALYHGTTGSKRLGARWPVGPVAALALGPDGDALVGAGPGRLAQALLDNPHPEVSLRSLLLPVAYEGHASPSLIWQSGGGSDGFERKLSITPLIVGTLKATFYAMLISVPLALLAAVYVSQLAPARLQAIVKPVVELMAAVPSVVVGFLAALWLAPRLEAVLFQAVLGVAALPLVVLTAFGMWRLAPAALRLRAPAGIELALLLAAGVVVVIGVTAAAGPLEARLFGGDITRWLFTEWGIRYDQRNALVVGIALGFAVIPVIFTIAEDACSSVPRSLTHAARALGATRWQAAIRMVVPAASPGLFAAVILGFGRAVGETMIVLMCSGNTPLLDLGPFDGMRTMAAAIAFEIPEAAVNGTLYRVLFLTGLLLFVSTFVITSAADLVGRALRKRYARF